MDQVRIGVIGVSGRGNLAKNWHKPHGSSIVVAGADINSEYLNDFKSNINRDAYITSDYRELLERKDIDAIAVMSPDYCHEEQAIAALNAGKHVFCEKPLAITVDGCDNILKAWKKSDKHLMVGFNMRYMPMFRTMKEVISSGAIGEVKAVWCRHFVGFGGNFYYHDWHATRDNTTSLLLQKGSHDIDVIHWLTGHYTKKVAAFGSLDYFGGDYSDDLNCFECDKKDTCVEVNLVKTRSKCAFRKEVNVEDNQVMIMELENGIKASYMQCHFTPDYHRNYTIIGTEGRIENSEPDNTIIVKSPKTNNWKEYSDVTYNMKEFKSGHSGADSIITKDFIDMILYDKKPVADPLSGRMSVATGCAATESLRAGGKLMTVNRPGGAL